MQLWWVVAVHPTVMVVTPHLMVQPLLVVAVVARLVAMVGQVVRAVVVQNLLIVEVLVWPAKVMLERLEQGLWQVVVVVQVR